MEVTPELEHELLRVMAAEALSTHFQAIINVQAAQIYGYEALTRGPEHSPLHSPLALFEVAARLGRLVELERLVLRLILARFEAQRLPGKLFINVSTDLVISSFLAREALVPATLPASRIVLELTETRPVADQAALLGAIEALRALGYILAIDDLGEGFASLRRWSELRPGYVKLDRHFITGVHRDALKQQFVRSMLQMALSSGSTLIAEGLEEAADLHMLQQMGVAVCQGFLLAHPERAPQALLGAQTQSLIEAGRPRGGRRVQLGEQYEKPTTAGELARRGPTVSAEISCAEVMAMFSADPALYSLPVLEADGRPLGLLRSMDVLKRVNERYFLDLFGRRSCRCIMDEAPLIFDCKATLRTMSDAVVVLDDRQMVDGFIVTREGRYFGIGRISDLIKAISDLQVFSARYANPLTLLPGNVPIDAQIDALLQQQQNFVAVHWDLDNFKPFNDLYGYRAGDELIQLTARILRETVDGERDFLGHIGGDDFVTLFCSADWEARIARSLAQFDAQVLGFFTAEHRAAGGFFTQNRQGQHCFHPLTALSAGVVKVEARAFEAAAQLAHAMSSAKKQAKKIDGSAYFVERRRTQLEPAVSGA